MYLFMYSSRPGATIIRFKLLVPSDCDCFPPAGGRRLSELLANVEVASVFYPLLPVTCRSAQPSHGTRSGDHLLQSGALNRLFSFPLFLELLKRVSTV